MNQNLKIKNKAHFNLKLIRIQILKKRIFSLKLIRIQILNALI